MKRWPEYVLFGLFILFAAWLVDAGSTIDELRFYRFDSRQWQQAAPSQRYFMAQYLLDKDHLAHRSREEVINMLGNPATSSDAKWVSYDLGRKRGLAMDAEPRLFIVFDKDGRVSDCHIVSST
jgi:hypothetical protein